MRRSRVARSLLASAAFLSLVLSLTACAEDGDAETATASSPAPPEEVGDPTDVDAGVTVTTRPCGLLSAEQVTDVLGKAVGSGITQAQADGVLTCTYGDLTGRGLQFGASPASAWAQALPLLLERARPAVAEALDALEQLDRAARLIESGAGLTDDEACEAFRTIALANGGVESEGIFLSVYPTSANPERSTAQTCRDGVFASLMVVRPDLANTPEQARLLIDSLESVLTNALEE